LPANSQLVYSAYDSYVPYTLSILFFKLRPSFSKLKTYRSFKIQLGYNIR